MLFLQSKVFLLGPKLWQQCIRGFLVCNSVLFSLSQDTLEKEISNLIEAFRIR